MSFLRPLAHKSFEQVAYVLLDIFISFGALAVLQCDDGRKYAEELCTM